MIATLTNDAIKIWRLSASCEKVDEITSPQGVNGKLLNISWNHTNQVIAISNAFGEIQLFHSQTGELLSNIPFDLTTNSSTKNCPSHSLSFSENSRYISQSIQSSVLMWDLKKRILKHSFVCGCDVAALSYLQDSKLAAGDVSGTVYLWDLKTNQLHGSIAPKDINASSITHLKSASSRIATSLSDGQLNIYDINTMTLIRAQSIHSQSVSGMSFSPKNSRLIASCGLDGKLSLTDVLSKTHEPTASIVTGAILTSLSFHEDAVHTAVSTNDGKILLYDWRNIRKPVLLWDAHPSNLIHAIAFQNLSLAPTEPSAVSSPHTATATATAAVATNGVSSKSDNNSVASASIATSAFSRSIVGASTGHPSTLPPPPLPQSHRTTDASSIPRQTLLHSAVSSRASVGTPPPAAVAVNATSNADDLERSLLSSVGSVSAIAATRPFTNNITTDTAASTDSNLFTTKATAATSSSSSSSSNTKFSAPKAPPMQTPAAPAPAPTFSSPLKPPTKSSAAVAAETITPRRDNQYSASNSLLVSPIMNTSTLSGVSGSSGSSSGSVPRAGASSQQYTGESSSSSKHTQGPSSQQQPDDSNINYRQQEQHQQQQSAGSTNSNLNTSSVDIDSSAYANLKQSLQPVTHQQLQEALNSLRYDVHLDVQDSMREQSRLYELSQRDMADMFGKMENMLQALLDANQELREENERLRHIY